MDRNGSVQMCPQHTNEPMKYFCQDHSQIICASGAICDHRMCKIVPIEENPISPNSQVEDMEKSQKPSVSAASIAIHGEVPYQLGIAAPPTAPPGSMLTMRHEINTQHDDYSFEYQNYGNNVPPPSYASVVQAPTVDIRTPMSIPTTNSGQPNVTYALPCDANNPSAITVVPTLTLETSIPVRTDTDKKRCRIVGVIFLNNGNIALADKKNKNVKLLHSVELRVFREAKFEVAPFGIVEVPSGNLAVTFPKKKEMLFLDIENLNTTGRSIKLDQPCRGAAYALDMLFVVCDVTWRHSGVIRVYGTDDQFLYKLKHDRQNKDIISPHTVHLSVFPETGNLMFNTGGLINGRIHVITPRGELVWKETILDGTELPEGSTVLGEGVVVALYNGLKFFSPKCPGSWRHLFGEPHLHPYAVAVNKDRSKLIMTQTKYHSDSIEPDSIKLFKVSCL